MTGICTRTTEWPLTFVLGHWPWTHPDHYFDLVPLYSLVYRCANLFFTKIAWKWKNLDPGGILDPYPPSSLLIITIIIYASFTLPEMDSGTDSDSDSCSYRNKEQESESESVQCEMFCIIQCIHQVWNLNLGCVRFPEILQNFSERQILWSLCSVVFDALTLRLPIQTSLPVAPKLSVFFAFRWKLSKFQENEHTSKYGNVMNKKTDL